MPIARSPRIAFFDIETAPILGYTWEMFEANVFHVVQPTYMLCYSIKMADSKKIKTRRLCDYPGYQEDKTCDKALATELHEDMAKCDLIVGHNGDSFDLKKSNARFIVHGLQPPPPIKSIDTLKIARKHFKFDSDKLDNIGRYLKVGCKTPNMSKDIWLGCIDGDPVAWGKMGRYNAQDVRLLEAVFHRVAPWYSSHPNLPAYSGASGCPTCQSANVQMRGFNVAKSRRTQRLQCQDCGHWFSGAAVKAGS